MDKLTINDIAQLRAAGKLAQEESVLKEGDVIVAVNVRTGERRVIDTQGMILESKKQLLLD